MVPTESLKGEVFLLSQVLADHRSEPAKPSLPSCPNSAYILRPDCQEARKEISRALLVQAQGKEAGPHQDFTLPGARHIIASSVIKCQ